MGSKSVSSPVIGGLAGRHEQMSAALSSPAPAAASPGHEPDIMAGQPVRLAVTGQRRSGGTQLLVRVAGEVDLATAPALAEALELTRRYARKVGGITEIVIDLRPVKFLSAAGLAVLARAHSRCHRDAVPLRVVADRRAVILPLRLTGLDETLRLRVEPGIPTSDHVSAGVADQAGRPEVREEPA